MELKLIWMLVKRWYWLLGLGALLGAAGAYVFSINQAPTYQASTKIMVRQAPRSGVSDVRVQTASELADTYMELLLTRPVIEETSRRLGYNVRANQISARRVGSSGLLEVVVRDTVPWRAADIANEVVEVLIAKNEELQAGLFSSTEESLQAQIAQVEEQLEAVQAEVSVDSEETLESRREQLEAELAGLEEQIYALQSEISTLEVEIETLMPSASIDGAAPTLSPTEQRRLSDLRTQVAQKRFQLNLAQQQYSALAAQLNSDGVTASRSGQSGQQESALNLYQQIYSNLLSSYEAVRLARLQSTAHVIQVEAAVAPPRMPNAASPDKILLGAAIGLLLAGGIAFLVEYFDDTLKTPVDVTRVTGLPVIGRILAFSHPKNKEPGQRPFVAENPRAAQTEAFRTLLTNLEFAGTERPLKSVLFTSIIPEEGKSTTVMNLARIALQAGLKTAVVDCDLRQPSVHSQLGVKNAIGIVDYLEGRADAEEVVISRSQPMGAGEFFVVTSGPLPRYPTELLRSERMNEILEHLRDIADLVLIDSPPMIAADAAVLASNVDGVVLVMQPGRSNAETALAVVEQLNRVGAHIVGVVLNRVKEKGSQYLDVRDLYHYDPEGVVRTGGRRLRGVRVAVQKILSAF